MTTLNGLKCTYSIQDTQINILDLTLIGQVTTGISVLYRTNTATNLTLMATSSHPPHVIKNIPVGELIHYNEIVHIPLNTKPWKQKLQTAQRYENTPDGAQIEPQKQCQIFQGIHLWRTNALKSKKEYIKTYLGTNIN